MGPDKFSDTIARARSKIQREPILAKENGRLKAKLAEAEELLKAYHKSDPDIEPRNGSKRVVNEDSEEEMNNTLLAAAMKLATSNG